MHFIKGENDQIFYRNHLSLFCLFQQAASLLSDGIENEYPEPFPLYAVNNFQLQLFRIYMKSLENLFP